MRLQIGFAGWLLIMMISGVAVERVQVSGTYSNLQYNEQSGDLNGIEIKITPLVGNRMQAVVLLSTGEPSAFFLATVIHEGNAIRVEGRQGEGRTWTLTGHVMPEELTGTVKEGKAPERHVRLPRRCSYWDVAR